MNGISPIINIQTLLQISKRVFQGSQTLHTTVTSFFRSLHTKGKNCHFIPVTSYQVTSYKAILHTSHFIPSHFIPRSLHTSHFIPKSLHTNHFIPGTLYQSHFIPVTSYQSHFISKPLHTKVTSYQGHFIPRSLHTSHFIPKSFIPKPLHTKVTSYRNHFIPRSLNAEITSYHSLHIEFYFIPKSLHQSNFMPLTKFFTSP